MDIAAVIVSYNSEKFLPANLASLRSQSRPFKQIIVIDNASDDRSPDLSAATPGVQAVRLQKNLGYPAAANLGIRLADTDLILVANSDTVFNPDFNQAVLDTFTRQPGLGLLSPLLLRPDRQTVDSAGQTYSPALHPREIGYNRPRQRLNLRAGETFSCCGAATVFSRPALERLRIGDEYYDEDFFLFWEDFDIGWRAQLLGIRVYFQPAAVLTHQRSGTLVKNRLARYSLALARPPDIQFHLVKNRYLTLIKNFRWRRFWWTIPFMLVRDAAWVGALTARSPGIIIRLMKAGPLFRLARRKRQVIRDHE